MYQIQLLQHALRENTIAFLETGSGKTFISVMLIRRMARHFRESIALAATFRPGDTLRMDIEDKALLAAQSAAEGDLDTHTLSDKLLAAASRAGCGSDQPIEGAEPFSDGELEDTSVKLEPNAEHSGADASAPAITSMAVGDRSPTGEQEGPVASCCEPQADAGVSAVPEAEGPRRKPGTVVGKSVTPQTGILFLFLTSF